tara:strand:+ start:160 stop:813 length:654 start_codon:yes stop_codon:yes gene_type:complete
MLSNLPLQSVIKESSKSKKIPLLILLHGYGSDENDLFSFAKELPKELCIISLRAPIKIIPYGYAWYNINFDENKNKWNDTKQAKKAMNTVLDFIDRAISMYKIDKTNISLLGFSQGCILGLALALNNPKKFKNIIGLSGYLSEDFLNKPLKKNGYKHLNFYCSHGNSDQVIPVEWARKTPLFLKNLNIKCKYTEFPVGHGVSPENFFELRDWLKSVI